MPIQTSTLTQYRRLQEKLNPLRVAVLTIDAASIDESVRTAAGIEPAAIMASLPANSHFVSAIFDGRESLDVSRCEREWVALALSCQRNHPDVGGWLFECANMPPYSAAVQHATGLTVYDALSLGRELYASASA